MEPRGPSGCATPERDAASWAQVPGSEVPRDALVSSSLAYGATAGQYARLAEVSAPQRLENGGGRNGTVAVPAVSKVRQRRPAL